MPAAQQQHAVERHGLNTPNDRRPGGRRPADRTHHEPPLAHATPQPIGRNRPSPDLRVLGADVSPTVVLAVIAATAVTPAGLLAGVASGAAGGGTVAVISAVATVIGGVLGVLGTAWKTNAGLRSQIQRDAQEWIKAQSAEINELRKDVAGLATFRDDVTGYLARDKAWHETVTDLLHANGIDAPAPPPMPTIHHPKESS